MQQSKIEHTYTIPEIAEDVLFPIWMSIPPKRKATNNPARIWGEFAARLRAASYEITVGRFVTNVCNGFGVREVPDINVDFFTLDRSQNSAVISLIRNESMGLVAYVRARVRFEVTAIQNLLKSGLDLGEDPLLKKMSARLEAIRDTVE